MPSGLCAFNVQIVLANVRALTASCLQALHAKLAGLRARAFAVQTVAAAAAAASADAVRTALCSLRSFGAKNRNCNSLQGSMRKPMRAHGRTV